MSSRWKYAARLALAMALLGGCAAEAASGPATPGGRGSRGVGVGGPQDIARFRSIVERGEVPAPATLDPVGFFAEHAFDLPPADCGDVVCAQPALAVAPRFDGSNWTMAFVAMNSAVDPATLARPPIHVAIAIEDTARIPFTETELISALRELVIALRPEDRVSIVSIGDRAEVLVEGTNRDDPELGNAVRSITAPPTSARAATYDGLALAGEVLEGFAGQRRIILLTSGYADGGIASESRTISLARALAASGTTLSIVGAGEQFSDRLPLALGELGAGAYYFADTSAALLEILRLEGQTALFPLATDFTLELTASAGYAIGRVYGALSYRTEGDRVTITSPVLLLGQREGAMDVDRGRRGGGGGFFVELIAEPDALSLGPGRAAFSVRTSYTDNATGLRVEASEDVINALAPGQNPEGAWAHFTDDSLGKVFMTLNMYLALRGATDFYSTGDCARAMGVADMMQRSVEGWQARYDDPDIEADWELLLSLRANVEGRCSASEPVMPIEPVRWREASCGYL